MRTRERFARTMGYRNPDRVSLFDEGLREDTLERWRQDGRPVGEALNKRFRYDTRFVLKPDLYPGTPLLERNGLETYSRGLDSSNPARQPEELADALRHPREDCVIGLQAHVGLFEALGVEDWTGFKQTLLLMADDPALVREGMERYASFVLELVSGILEQIDVDYVSFSEPIGANRGPLIAPCMYRDLALSSYRPLLDFFHQHGVAVRVFTTYANARLLLPDILEAGFNTLWAVESESEEMDYRGIRRTFGRDLRLIGGLDLDALMRGREAIERELSEKLPTLLESGGYIPLADGRVRVTMPYDLYAFYRDRLESWCMA